MFVAAVGGGRAEQATRERIESQATRVKRASGWVLGGVGAWFLVLAAFAGTFETVFPV